MSGHWRCAFLLVAAAACAVLVGCGEIGPHDSLSDEGVTADLLPDANADASCGEPAPPSLAPFVVGCPSVPDLTDQAVATNGGPDGATILSVVAFSKAGEFAARSCADPPVEVAPCETCEVVVTFAPASDGAFSGLLRVEFADAPAIDIALCGLSGRCEGACEP